MSHLALKDLFSGFFVIDDEEEVEVPDKQQQVNEAPAKEQSQQTTKQNESNQSLKNLHQDIQQRQKKGITVCLIIQKIIHVML